METVRVVLVDDHRAFSGALTALLSRQPDIEVAASVPSASAARAAIDTLAPDVAVIDVDLAGESGIDLIEAVLSADPSSRVVVLTCHDDVDTAIAAARAGALGFVAKDETAHELTTAIRRAARGEAHFPPHLLSHVLRRFSRGGADRSPDLTDVSGLTPREREVLGCMMAGLERKAIAQRLHLSPNTVRTHVRNILSKLDVHSTLEAVSLAYRAGLRPPGELLAHHEGTSA